MRQAMGRPMAVTAEVKQPKDAPAAAQVERAPAAGDARLTGSGLLSPLSSAYRAGLPRNGPGAPPAPDLLGNLPSLRGRQSLVLHTQHLHGNQHAQRLINRHKGAVSPGGGGRAAAGRQRSSAANGHVPAGAASPGAGPLGAAKPPAATALLNEAAAMGEVGSGSNGSLPAPHGGAEERAVDIAEILPVVEQVSRSASSSMAASFGQKIAGVERTAGAAISQIQGAAGGLMGRIETAFGAGRSALTAAFGQSRAEVEQASVAARTEVQQSAVSGRQQAETGKKSSLGQVDEGLHGATSQLQAQVETVRTEVQPAAGQAAVDKEAEAVAANYQGSDGAEEARAAAVEIAGRTSTEYAAQSSGVSSELDGVASDVTRGWETEGQTARQYVDDAVQAAASAIDQGRSQAEDGITAKVDEQLGELSAGEAETLTQLETSQAELAGEADTSIQTALKTAETDRQTQRQELETGRDEALAATEGARTEFSTLIQEYPDATADPAAVRAYLEDAAATHLQDLDKHLEGYQAESDAAWHEGTEHYAGQARAAGDEVAASVEAGTETTTSTLSGLVVEADQALSGLGADAGQRMADVGAQATTAMAGVAQQVQIGIDQGLTSFAGSLAQGQASFQSSSAAAVGQSRSAMEQAAEQATRSALNPRKLVGDLLSFVGPLWSSLVAPYLQFAWNWSSWWLKQMVNFWSGFWAGETLFKDVWGADVVAFMGDLIAGFLVIGDIRDVLKNLGFFFWDLFQGKGPKWLYLFLVVVAVVSFIPWGGDIVSVIRKVFQYFVKKAAQKLAKEITERLLTEFSQAAIDRLVKELGEELVTELVQELGEKTLKELVDNVGEAGVKQLVKTFTVDGLKGLLKEFSAADLKKLMDAFPLNTLKDLVDRFLVKGLKDLVDKLGIQVLKDAVNLLGDAFLEIVETFSAAGLKTLIDTFTVKGLKEAVDGVGAQALRELVDTFSAKGAKELVDTFQVDGLQKLVVAFPVKSLKELVDTFTVKGLKELTDEVGIQTLKDLGPDALKQIGTHLNPKELADFVKDLGIDKVKDLARKYGGDAMKHYGKAFFKSYQGVTQNTMNHLLVNHGIKKGEILGCHDKATFLTELTGIGRVVDHTPGPNGAVRFAYKLFQKDQTGKIIFPHKLSTGKEKLKTVIDGLAADPAKWLAIGNAAADDAIRRKVFPAVGGWFSGVGLGVKIKGVFRPDEVDTFFPDF